MWVCACHRSRNAKTDFHEINTGRYIAIGLPHTILIVKIDSVILSYIFRYDPYQPEVKYLLSYRRLFFRQSFVVTIIFRLKMIIEC